MSNLRHGRADSYLPEVTCLFSVWGKRPGFWMGPTVWGQRQCLRGQTLESDPCELILGLAPPGCVA